MHSEFQRYNETANVIVAVVYLICVRYFASDSLSKSTGRRGEREKWREEGKERGRREKRRGEVQGTAKRRERGGKG